MREALFAFVVNAAWQVVLIAGFGLVLAKLTHPARRRFELLALTLVASAAAPAMTLVPRAAPTAVVAAFDLPAVETRRADAIALLYLFGLAFVAVRLLLAALRARRIAAASLPFRGRMRLSHVIDSPVTIGRAVLLPPGVADDRSLLAAAVAHEHAHVRRNDYLMHVALELIALPLYFHPMVFVLRRALADAREMACDDEAAERHGRRKYAEALVRLSSLAARSRMRMAVGIAATSVERRVAALLGASSNRRTAGIALLILPLVVAAACTRFNAAPAVEQATLCGRWALIPEASDFHATGPPSSYDAFVQTIEQGPTRVSVRQQRTIRGRTKAIAWSVITDGVTRPVQGIRETHGAASWDDGKLRLHLAGPGAHRETATAFLRDQRLVVDGQTERGRYHAEFRRIDP